MSLHRVVGRSERLSLSLNRAVGPCVFVCVFEACCGFMCVSERCCRTV